MVPFPWPEIIDNVVKTRTLRPLGVKLILHDSVKTSNCGPWWGCNREGSGNLSVQRETWLPSGGSAVVML